MSNAVVPYTPEQVDLIKRSICKGASNDELQLFLHQCQKTGLDPFSKQIFAIKRRSQNDKGEWVDAMTVQTGIAGYQLIAERTGCYVPGREPTYAYDADGNLISATSYVKKLAAGVWHEIGRTAFYDEFVQVKRDGQPTKFWKEKPRFMLAKCAEALALRTAFPHELSGIYTDTEMPEPETQDAEFTPRPAPILLEQKSSGDESARLLQLQQSNFAAATTLAQLDAAAKSLSAEQKGKLLPLDLDALRKAYKTNLDRLNAASVTPAKNGNGTSNKVIFKSGEEYITFLNRRVPSYEQDGHLTAREVWSVLEMKAQEEGKGEMKTWDEATVMGWAVPISNRFFSKMLEDDKRLIKTDDADEIDIALEEQDTDLFAVGKLAGLTLAGKNVSGDLNRREYNLIRAILKPAQPASSKTPTPSNN